jgi:hypothetical protein
MRIHSRLLVILAIVVLGIAPGRTQATAGLSGYFEWVLWKDVKAENSAERGETGAKLEWIVGPYPKLSECERERDRLAESTVEHSRQPSSTRPIAADGVVSVTSDNITIRFFCVPDTVNPRVDRRWP